MKVERISRKEKREVAKFVRFIEEIIERYTLNNAIISERTDEFDPSVGRPAFRRNFTNVHDNLVNHLALLKVHIANKDKFIWAVRELSETYEIDADLKEDDDGYTAFLYMNYASYNGYIKKLLGLIFILSDDFSMFKAKDNRDSDLLMCFTYHTHNVYLKDREITDFE